MRSTCKLYFESSAAGLLGLCQACALMQVSGTLCGSVTGLEAGRRGRVAEFKPAPSSCSGAVGDRPGQARYKQQGVGVRYCVSRPDDAGREVPLSNKWIRSKHAGISSSRASGRAGHYACSGHACTWVEYVTGRWCRSVSRQNSSVSAEGAA